MLPLANYLQLLYIHVSLTEHLINVHCKNVHVLASDSLLIERHPCKNSLKILENHKNFDLDRWGSVGKVCD